MKSFTTLKSFAIFAILTIFITSCSSERYGHIQRGTAKAQDVAKVEKTPKNVIETTEEVATTEETETTTPVATTTAPKTETFKATEALKNIQTAVAKEKVSKSNMARMFKNIVTKSPLAKIGAPYQIVKNPDANHAKKHEVDMFVLILLAILIPPVAVGLVSDWSDSKALIISILLTLCFWLPGIIHAIIYVNNNN